MVAYEIYCLDKAQGPHLIGVLPERRRRPERITERSIMERVRQFLPDNEAFRSIFLVKVSLNEEKEWIEREGYHA